MNRMQGLDAKMAIANGDQANAPLGGLGRRAAAGMSSFVVAPLARGAKREPGHAHDGSGMLHFGPATSTPFDPDQAGAGIL